MMFWLQTHGTAAIAVLLGTLLALAAVVLLWALFG
jgi:hypothetical protein